MDEVQKGATRHVIPDVGAIPVVEVGSRLDGLSRDLARVVVDQLPSPGQSKALARRREFPRVSKRPR